MPSATMRRPAFTTLTHAECWKLLGRLHVGRLAFFNHGVVDIEPVNYVAKDSWLFLRSRRGTKLEVFTHHPYVAFEADEVRADVDWESVVAHGTVYMLSAKSIGIDHAVYERALRALRSYVPAAFTRDDPTPSRTVVYGIHVDHVTGRRAMRARHRSRHAPQRRVIDAGRHYEIRAPS